MERVTDTNKAKGVRAINNAMPSKHHLRHGVHKHRQQSHRLDRIEQLPVALRPVRMRERVPVVALNSLKLLWIVADPMDPGEALEMVDLADRMEHFPAQLSGGEQQRIAIARAIAKRPEVLLCDEPTGALDSKTGVLVLEAIDRVSRELGTTAAIITHNAGIREIARRVFYFKDGRIEREEINEQQLSPSEVVW